jgi:carboxyl-terminal processing protease
MLFMKKITARGRKWLLGLAIVGASLGSLSFVDEYFEISKNLDIFTGIYKEVHTYYVDDVEPGKLMRTGIDAMLESLDPYTSYYSEAETEDYRFQITGQYGGIGAVEMN